MNILNIIFLGMVTWIWVNFIFVLTYFTVTKLHKQKLFIFFWQTSFDNGLSIQTNIGTVRWIKHPFNFCVILLDISCINQSLNLLSGFMYRDGWAISIITILLNGSVSAGGICSTSHRFQQPEQIQQSEQSAEKTVPWSHSYDLTSVHNYYRRIWIVYCIITENPHYKYNKFL